MSTINYAKMQSKAWYGDERITLRFPEGWEVNTVTPQDGATRSVLQSFH